MGGGGEKQDVRFTLKVECFGDQVHPGFFRGGEEKSFKIIFISLGLEQVLSYWVRL